MTALRRLPLPAWLRDYQREDLRSDLNAGLTVAVMLVPQGMAYAMLAGLPPIVGLYASVVPLFVYALFGSSRQLAVGPVAMVSLLTATGVAAVSAGDPERYIAAAVMLAAMVGVVQLGMGLLRLGYLVNFLSHPVLSGFTSAAALIIGLNQLKHLLGISIPRGHHIHTIVIEAARGITGAHLATLAIGLGSIALLIGLKKWRPSFPGALVAVAGTTAIVALFGLGGAGVATVGQVPAGLPLPSLPVFDLAMIQALVPTALAISLVGFMESISVAKVFARKHDYKLDPGRELIGLGAANLAAAAFGAYPVTGGFSRSAVNDQAGARTPLASLITAVMVGAALLFLTPLFFHVPKAVLAAIIMVAVVGLIDVAEVKHLWKVKRSDLGLLVVTFAATLAFGIEQGIAIGVGASLVLFVAQRTRPHFPVLGRLPGSTVYRNVADFPHAEREPGVLVVRLDAAFYFGNVTFLEDSLERLEAEEDQPLRAVVLDATAINDLDSTAAHALESLSCRYAAGGVRFLLAGVKSPVRRIMEKAGLDCHFGPANMPLTVHAALRELERPTPTLRSA
jgi:sulfate permease, SulP family